MTNSRKNFYLGYMQALIWDQGFHDEIREFRLPNPTEPYCVTAENEEVEFSIADLMTCWAEVDDGAIHYFQVVRSLGDPADPILMVACTEDSSMKDLWDSEFLNLWHTADDEAHWQHVQASWA